MDDKARLTLASALVALFTLGVLTGCASTPITPEHPRYAYTYIGVSSPQASLRLSCLLISPGSTALELRRFSERNTKGGLR